MNQLVTPAIVLARTNYGEADRIVRFLTPEAGKISLVARGVRRPKSKLAGGIELFSVSQLTYIRGRGDLGTLISARLERHYGNIVKRIDRVQLGYELIKVLDRTTEDQPEVDYFELLQQTFMTLDDQSIDVALVRLWFGTRLIAFAGYAPNLQLDNSGQPLRAGERYGFDIDAMAFYGQDKGSYTADAIKFLRLLFAGTGPKTLQQVQGGSALVELLLPLVNLWQQQYIN